MLLSCAFLYFLLIISGFKSAKLLRPSWLNPLRTAYQLVTGAGSSFGFFSPNIGNQFQIRFEFNPSTYPSVALPELVSREVAIRIGNMHRFFLKNYKDEQLKRSIAASLTASVFEKFPNATEITFIAEIYRLPTMKEYSSGSRVEVREVYRAKFINSRRQK